jgi:uncharacterized protein (DUF1800 family)
MVVTSQLKSQHLLSRAGFGISAAQLSTLSNASHKEVYAALVKASTTTPDYFDVADNNLKGLFMGLGDVIKMEQLRKNGVDNDTKKKIRTQSREDLKSLNLTWLNEMVTTEAQLREKVALFWHGHFACRDVNIFHQQMLLKVIRENALGKFGDLLSGVSKTAAMLGFLNNQQNKKEKPNENFAREVMELFTMGRGNYTEKDIKEAARAFTGWGFNLKGEFQFRRFQHDNGSKTVLGKTGKFNGDDVLQILLEQKQTAIHITRKVYRYFVNDVADEKQVKLLAERFYQSNYDIAALMQDIFTADWFYDAKNIGCKIKSPVELLIGIRRLLPMEVENEQLFLLMQRALGQLLFYPPNVAGWSGGKNWIDSSTMMLRLRIPQLIKDNDTFSINAKTDDDQQMGMMEKYKGKKTMNALGKGGFTINANVDWDAYIKQFEQVKREQLMKVLETTVLLTKAGSVNLQTVEQFADKSSREAYIKSVTIELMSTPEYQLA